jgi:hypothetical protein
MTRAELSRIEKDFGDTVTLQLREADGTSSDLTGATAAFVQVRREGYNTLLWNHAAVLVPPLTSGVITYLVQASDFIVPGKYYLQVSIVFGGVKEISYDIAAVEVAPEHA